MNTKLKEKLARLLQQPNKEVLHRIIDDFADKLDRPDWLCTFRSEADLVYKTLKNEFACGVLFSLINIAKLLSLKNSCEKNAEAALLEREEQIIPKMMDFEELYEQIIQMQLCFSPQQRRALSQIQNLFDLIDYLYKEQSISEQELRKYMNDIYRLSGLRKGFNG